MGCVQPWVVCALHGYRFGAPPMSGPSESWVRPVDVDVVGRVVPEYVVRVVVAAWWPAMEVMLVLCECM